MTIGYQFLLITILETVGMFWYVIYFDDDEMMAIKILWLNRMKNGDIDYVFNNSQDIDA